MGDGSDPGLSASTLRSLSQRAIVLSEPNDKVVVDEQPDQALIDYLNSIGIQTGSINIAHGSGQTLIDRILSDQPLIDNLKPQQWMLEPYMGGDQVEQLAGVLNTFPNSPPTPLLNRLNLKSNLCAILGHAGLPTIPTTTTSASDVAATTKHMLHEFGALMVRSDLSIGGLGVWPIKSVSDIKDLERGAAHARHDRLFIIQPLLKASSSPNAQYRIRDSEACFLGISSQQMTPHFAFGGNEYPFPDASNPQIRAQADQIIEWLVEAGYRGLVGIDFIVTDQGVYIVEINPRVNTSTFPLKLMDRLGCTSFRLITGLTLGDRLGFDPVAQFCGDLLFCTERRAGFVPLMIPSEQRPVLDAMVFGQSNEEVADLSNLLKARIESCASFAGGSC